MSSSIRTAFWSVVGVLAFLLIGWLFLKIAVIRTVDTGNVGMVIDYTTSSSKPQVQVYLPGHIIWLNPFGARQFFEYPIANQTLVLASKDNEGEIPGNSTIACQMSGGGQINFGMTVTWQVDPNHPYTLYSKKPGVPLSSSFNADVATTLVYGVVSADTQDICSHYTWEDVLGDGTGASQVEQVRADLLHAFQADLGQDGILVDQVSIKERIPSAQIQAVLNAKLQAQQSSFMKTDAQNKADAQQITAKGNATAEIIQAQADATAITLVDKALANSPSYLQYLEIKEWDGHLPQYVGGSGQVQIGPLKAS